MKLAFLITLMISIMAQAQLTMNPAPVSGGIELTSSQTYIYLTNPTLSAIASNITVDTNSSGVSISLNRCGSSINAKQTCYIVISFSNYGKLKTAISLNLKNNSSSLALLTYNPVVPVVESSNFSVSSLSMNDFSNYTLSITNKTLSTKSYSPTFSGTDASKFSIALNRCSSIPAGGKCDILIKLAPQLAGSYSASMSESQVTGSVALSSTISSFTIGVIQPPTPSISVSPSSVSFGTLTHMGQSAAQIATITNNGNVSISPIVSVAGTGLKISLNRCLVLLGVGQSCTVSMYFDAINSLSNGSQSGLSFHAQASSSSSDISTPVSVILNVPPALLSSNNNSSSSLTLDTSLSQKIMVFLDPTNEVNDQTNLDDESFNYSALVIPNQFVDTLADLGSGFPYSESTASNLTTVQRPLIKIINTAAEPISPLFSIFSTTDQTSNSCSVALSLADCLVDIALDTKKIIVSVTNSLISSANASFSLITSQGSLSVPVSAKNVKIIFDNNGISMADCEDIYRSVGDKNESSLLLSIYNDNDGTCQKLHNFTPTGFTTLNYDTSSFSLDDSIMGTSIGIINNEAYYMHTRENGFGFTGSISKIDINTQALQRVTTAIMQDSSGGNAAAYIYNGEAPFYPLGSNIYTLMRSSSLVALKLGRLDIVHNDMYLISDLDFTLNGDHDYKFMGDFNGEVYFDYLTNTGFGWNHDIMKITSFNDVVLVKTLGVPSAGGPTKFDKNNNNAFFIMSGELYKIDLSGNIEKIVTIFDSVDEYISNVSKSSDDSSIYIETTTNYAQALKIYKLNGSNQLKKIYENSQIEIVSQDDNSFSIVGGSLYFIGFSKDRNLLYRLEEGSGDQNAYIQEIAFAIQMYVRNNDQDLYIVSPDKSQIMYIDLH